MNIAAKYHQPRRVKNLRRDRPFLRTVAPEIEPFRGGVRKNVVVGIIEVWELHSGADLHRQQRWKERQFLLRNLFRRRPRDAATARGRVPRWFFSETKVAADETDCAKGIGVPSIAAAGAGRHQSGVPKLR